MQNRCALLKVIAIVIAVIALATPTFLLADHSDIVKKATGDSGSTSLAKSNDDVFKLKKPVLYQRSSYVWPYAAGPYYGDVATEMGNSPYLLSTMVGSFDTRSGVFNIPGELRRGINLLSPNAAQYFLVQFDPNAFDMGKFEETRKEFESMGVQFFDYVSNRGFICLLNSTNYSIVSSSSKVQFLEPYHPAFKIAPNVGKNALPDPVAAISPIYSLIVMVFPNEPATLVAQTISQMGGMVKAVHGDTIYADIDRSKLGAIASIEAVRQIFEQTPNFPRGEETTTTMQKGDYINGAIPYFDVGVDGGGGGIASSAQKLQVIDSGASIDAADLSDTRTSPGTAGSTHRKVALYTALSGGDLQSCDSALSGGYSHGHIVSATALGNASDVPTSYGGGWLFYDTSNNPWKIDGVAKGAKLLFYDGYSTPVSGFCDETIGSGDLYGGTPGSGTLGDGYTNGARGANMSWGSSTDKTYNAQAQDIDEFLQENHEGMVFISAGNDSTDNNNDQMPDERTVGAPATAKNACVIGASYNANGAATYNVNARASFSSLGPVGSTTKPRVAPLLMAPGDDPWGSGSNVGLDSEYACKSQDNDQTGTVQCTQTSGSSGTSFSSPAAMGSSALVKDYFAQGFYPDGTSSNTNNSGDIIDPISGALVKAILIASADYMDGANITTSRKYRFSYEQGYGRIQLNNVLPLVTDPTTPIGLIVDDQGLSTGSGISAGGTVTINFNVTDNSVPLRAAVAWMDSVAEDIVNNLDLELWFDTNLDGTMQSTEPLYWGNFFNEDYNRDSTFNAASEDNDNDGSQDMGAWSLPIKGLGDGDSDGTMEAQRDTYNVNEGIFINNDENGDGTNDLPTGQWTLKIKAGSSNPSAQKYAVAIAGGVVLGSSVRFDKNPLLCSDIVHVIVNETDSENPDPGPAEAEARTTLYVINPGPDGMIDTTDDSTYDTETGITFAQQGTALKFKSVDLPTSDSGTQANDNGILDIEDGYYLKAVYLDTDAERFSYITSDCSIRLQSGISFTQWGRDYAYLIDGGCEINGLGRSFPDKHPDIGEKIVYWIAILNGESDTDLLDVDVSLRAVVPDTVNNDTDPGRLDNTTSPYINILNSPKVVGRLDAGSAMGIPFDLEVIGSPPFPTEVEMVLGVSARKSGKTINEYTVFKHLVNADDEVFHYSTDFPTGGTITRDYDNSETVGALYGDTVGDKARKGGQLDDPGEDWDLWYERVQFDDMTTTAYGGGNPSFNGPWDFNGDADGTDEAEDREFFRSGIHKESTVGTSQISLWGEDKDYDDTLDTGEDRDPADSKLTQNWGNGGGCGFQTKGAEAEAWKGGAWHTGNIYKDQQQGQVFCITGDVSKSVKCRPHEVRTGSTGENYWWEFLRTPEWNKVHVNNDANGYAYYAEFHHKTLQWNQQVDLSDDLTGFTYEVDTDTESETAVDLTDNTILNLYWGKMGLKSGGNQALLDGFSVFAPSNSSGNQTNGTVGTNRIGKRGCYFESLTSDQRTSPHGLAKPKDDDIDNDSDGTTDEFVTNNGPIKNMDSVKNNGLWDLYTLEDLYGDAGKKFMVAFGFMVVEGTPDTQPAGDHYGVAIDDVSVEWDEIHPVADVTDCAINGQCASMSIKSLNMYEGLSLIPVTVLDTNAAATQGSGPNWDKKSPSPQPDLQDSDSDGLSEIKVLAFSEAEPDGEYLYLEQVSSGSFEYAGNIPVSSAFNTTGVIFVKRDGTNYPTIYIRVVDKNDGVHPYNHGADGQPGVSGVDDDKYGADTKPGSADFDDDGDGTIDEADEWCPGGVAKGDDDCANLVDEADEHCPLGAGGILRPYGDDNCGCPNNPLQYSSSIFYPVGRMSVELVSVVADNGDGDGFADSNETVTLDITIKNLARDDNGEFRNLTNVVAKLQAVDHNFDGTINIACIPDGTAVFGDITAKSSKTNPSTDRFQIQIANVNRTGVYQDLDAELLLTISSNEIDGTYMPLKIFLPLDLDATGGSGVQTWEETFEGGLGKFDVLRVAAQDGIRCQYNDPNNPNSNSFGRANCNLDTVPIGLDQDWHVHGVSSPDAGRAYDGSQSLHWGYHLNPANAAYDTEHFQEMNIARTTSKLNLGINDVTNKAILSFKHQISILDYRGSNTPSGEAADRAVVMVARTDGSGNVQGNWIKVWPFTNVYNAQGTDQFTNCTFDPVDDGSNEDVFFPNDVRLGPSSTCKPEFVFSWLGNTDYKQTAAKFDPDALGNGDGPGLLGSLGPGTWVESKFNLERFQGYMIKFRFLATTIEVYPAQSYADAGWPPDIAEDDGWYVDQVRVANTVSTAYTLSADSDTPPASTCPSDPSQNCDTMTANVTCSPDGVDNDQDGTIDESGEDNCKTLAPGHRVILTASGSVSNNCVGGTHQFQWWQDNDKDGTIDSGDTMLYDWSERSYYYDAPTEDTQYCAKAVCSSDSSCLGVACQLVDVYTGAGCIYGAPPVKVTGLAYLSKNKTTFSWPAVADTENYDTVKGDLKLLRSTKGDFSSTITSCLENDDLDTQATDTATPPANGEGFYYLTRANNCAGNGTYNTETAKQIGDRDTEIASDPEKCP